MTEPLMAGIDLHSNNLVIGLVDQNGQRLYNCLGICTVLK